MRTLSKSRRRRLLTLAFVPLVIAAIFLLNLYVSQEDLMFPGTKLPTDHEFNFAVPFEEVSISVEGAELNGLHFQQTDPRGLVFFLHGNGGNLESWTSNVGYYQQVNYDMFIFDYRGYGKSTGQIESEQQLHEDVLAVWNKIAPQYSDRPIVLYGRSLGSALAVNLATSVDPDLLVLVSPFTSMVAMARQQYPFVPEWMVKYPFRTDELIASVKAPIVLIHGDEDGFIPLEHSLVLQSRAISNTKLMVIRGAGHGDIHRHESYLDGLAFELPN